MTIVNIKSQRRSMFTLERYFKPRVKLKLDGYHKYSPVVLLFYLFLLMVLAMYNYNSINRTLFPYKVQPNIETASTESLSPLVWEWYRYSSSTATTSDSLQSTSNKDTHNRGPRLLIAQYIAPGKSAYSNILEASSPVNRAYAKMYGYDYVILRGIGLRVPWVDSEARPPPLNRAAFNKITLLQHALMSGSYDQLLILDSDAIMYDFSKDVTDFGGGKMVAGHKNRDKGLPVAWNINNGVTLWNLRHAEIKAFVDEWGRRAKWWIWLDHPMAHNDQASFHTTLQFHSIFSFRRAFVELVSPVVKEFMNGTIVHVMRPNSKTWINVNVTSRVDTIQKYKDEVCERYAPICDNIDVMIQ